MDVKSSPLAGKNGEMKREKKIVTFVPQRSPVGPCSADLLADDLCWSNAELDRVFEFRIVIRTNRHATGTA